MLFVHVPKMRISRFESMDAVPPLEVGAAYCVAVVAGLPSVAGWMFVGAALGAGVGC